MKSLKLEAQPRAETGTGAAGRLRRQGIVPAVIYGHGESNVNVQLNEHDFLQVLRGHASEQLIMDVDVAGERAHKVLLKEVQHHPVSGKIVHADFHEISMTERLTVEISVKLIGEPVGVSQQGGLLEHIGRTIEVDCLPDDIVEHFEADVSSLRIGDTLTAGELGLDPAKYELITDPEQPVATVAAPRVEEAETTAVESEAAAQPEVIKEKKKEEEEQKAE